MAAVAQAVRPLQQLVALQPVGQLLNIAVPLRLRQRVEVIQRRLRPLGAGEIEPVGVNLLRIPRFLRRQLPHQAVRFARLPGLAQIARQPVGDPDTARIERQPLALQRGGLRPLAFALQRFGLLR